MSRHNYKKFYEWNSEIAYLSGLIASDGCLLNNKRHLNITSKDFEIIENTKKILNLEVKVYTKNSIYGGHAYHLQFSNVSLYDFLTDCGLTPAKSKTIGKLKVPDEYYADFLRGYFDGDGTVYGGWDKRWKNSFMYYAGYVSASALFLDWLQKNNERLIDTGLGSVKRNKGAYTLTYAKNDSQKIFNFMYYKEDVPKLTRKYNKYLNFIQTDPYAKMCVDARVL